MFYADVTNSIEEPVEPFKRKGVNLINCIALASAERYKAASHTGSSKFVELRKTCVPKAQNLRTIHTFVCTSVVRDHMRAQQQRLRHENLHLASYKCWSGKPARFFP